jgi:hypothetical protein
MSLRAAVIRGKACHDALYGESEVKHGVSCLCKLQDRHCSTQPTRVCWEHGSTGIASEIERRSLGYNEDSIAENSANDGAALVLAAVWVES